FVATWFYGEPAAGKTVRYRLSLPDGGAIERTGTTNAAGEVAFALPTAGFAEEGLAVLQASLPADAVETRAAVPGVTTEFGPELTTVRQVYLAKEPFEVALVLHDRSGRPLPRAAELVLARLERGRAGGEVIETEVARQQVTTGADGRAKATFAAERGGDYRVR